MVKRVKQTDDKHGYLRMGKSKNSQKRKTRQAANKSPKLSVVAPPPSSFEPSQLDTFLYWIRERHSIHLLKSAEAPAPWTRDVFLQNFFFCNPFRENDKTTVWFREHLRGSVTTDPERTSVPSDGYDLSDSPQVVLSTVAFRWFNYIPTGELLSEYTDENETPANQFLQWDSQLVRSILKYHSEMGSKIFTGAYIIKSPNGQNKIDGICDCIDIVARCLNVVAIDKADPTDPVPLLQYSPQEVEWDIGDQGGADDIRCEFLLDLLNSQLTLEEAHSGFMLFPFLGDFMAYEVVTDLRHTKYLCNAEDIMTWCNLGPGAIRGLLRLIGEFVPGPANGSYRAPRGSQDLLLELLEITQKYFTGVNERLAPLKCSSAVAKAKHALTGSIFPTFEMRDIEHSLCEFDKYSRLLNGEGQVKRLYNGS